MKTGVRTVGLAIALSGLLLSSVVSAVEVEGVELPGRVAMGGETLVLNGAGVRTRFFFDIYVGALYLPETTDEASVALGMAGPKRVLLHFLYDEIGRDKLVEAWNDGFRNNLGTTERAALAERIERFNALFGSVRAGDEIALDFVPGEGTHVTLNGERMGTVPSDDFARAWLRIFIGDSPADAELKQGMLSKE
jgi:hypothetical protein